MEISIALFPSRILKFPAKYTATNGVIVAGTGTQGSAL